jgi:short subunit dehydrogenase-like uncharacterized protein
MKIIIYGANGYTGKLIVEKAINSEFDITIAGRSEKKISTMGKEYNLSYLTFTPNELESNPQILEDFEIMLNCAGPFSQTSKPIINACLETNTHYLDITGEIDIFRLGKSYHQKAIDSKIIICPGVGFDVIPTDCLASKLNESLSNADELILGFESTAGKISPGTMATSIESLGNGGRIRKNGEVIKVPLVYKSQRFDFGNGEKTMITIPWGDVATAGYSTNIPNISVYIPMHPKQVKQLKRINWFPWLLRLEFVQNLLKKKVKKTIKGPSVNDRDNSKTYVWGQIKKGNKVLEGRIVTSNGYELTVDGSLAVIDYIHQNKNKCGYFTPSQLCGNNLIELLPKSSKIKIKEVETN